MKSQAFSTYEQSLSTINRTLENTTKILSAVQEISSLCGSRIDAIVQKLIQIDLISLLSLNDSDRQLRSFLEHQLRFLAASIVNPAHNLSYLSNTIKQYFSDVIGDILFEYTKRAIRIKTQKDSVLNKFRSAAEASKIAHDEYFQAGKAVENAFSSKSSKLNYLRNAFVAAQLKALRAHRGLLVIQEITNDQIENLLTEFEHLEKWRTFQLEQALKVFGTRLEGVASLFRSTVDQVNALSEGIDTKDKIEHHLPEWSINCEVFPEFQIAPVPLISSAYLPPEKGFAELIPKGAKLGTILQDSNGDVQASMLKVSKGEVIAVMEKEGDVFKCIDINDCTGYVPIRLVQLHQ